MELKGIEELMTKLKREKSDHHDNLKLTDTASVSEVRDRYFSFVEKPPEITDFKIVSIIEDPRVSSGRDKKKPKDKKGSEPF
jgi:hypothetical protein